MTGGGYPPSGKRRSAQTAKAWAVTGYALSSVARPLVALATLPWHVLAVRVTDRIGKGVRGTARDALLLTRFPPSARDAPLLAPTLIELLAEQQGPAAVVRLVGRLHSGGPDAALLSAFPGQGLSSIESEWRSRLRRLADGG